ncbi:uncharacterized protein LOC121997667 [Zingiber officinale]|uniref:Uncharacterized protein n=1 Tax=Zingiber officinale TaxID=94328 RepID=A0A8J5KYF4_ZINOF|nr:uncharacterized protein LOC121997667 [Zingiber officinale]KAG6501129.1 hypothetical protein ZIOFF_040997 [Zingiber officinale]
MTTAATTTRSNSDKRCDGDGCDAAHPWPLHHIRYRGGVRRFCTSCVLKSHAGSFCVICFAVLDAVPAPAIAHCSKCPSASHISCLPHPNLASRFLCHCCRNPDSFSYYPAGEVPIESLEAETRTIDTESAKALVAASKLSVASMKRAAACARVEAERKVKDAIIARTKAKDMLERAALISHKESEKVHGANDSNNKLRTPMAAAVNPEKKMKAPNSNSPSSNEGSKPMAAEQRRIHSREREKWMRMHEPISTEHGLPQGTTDRRKSKAPSLAGAEATVAAADANNPVKIAPFSSKQKRIEREVKKTRLFGSMEGDADAKNY